MKTPLQMKSWQYTANRKVSNIPKTLVRTPQSYMHAEKVEIFRDGSITIQPPKVYVDYLASTPGQIRNNMTKGGKSGRAFYVSADKYKDIDTGVVHFTELHTSTRFHRNQGSIPLNDLATTVYNAGRLEQTLEHLGLGPVKLGLMTTEEFIATDSNELAEQFVANSLASLSATLTTQPVANHEAYQSKLEDIKKIVGQKMHLPMPSESKVAAKKAKITNLALSSANPHLELVSYADLARLRLEKTPYISGAPQFCPPVNFHYNSRTYEDAPTHFLTYFFRLKSNSETTDYLKRFFKPVIAKVFFHQSNPKWYQPFAVLEKIEREKQQAVLQAMVGIDPNTEVDERCFCNSSYRIEYFTEDALGHRSYAPTGMINYRFKPAALHHRRTPALNEPVYHTRPLYDFMRERTMSFEEVEAVNDVVSGQNCIWLRSPSSDSKLELKFINPVYQASYKELMRMRELKLKLIQGVEVCNYCNEANLDFLSKMANMVLDYVNKFDCSPYEVRFDRKALVSISTAASNPWSPCCNPTYHKNKDGSDDINSGLEYGIDIVNNGFVPTDALAETVRSSEGKQGYASTLYGLPLPFISTEPEPVMFNSESNIPIINFRSIKTHKILRVSASASIEQAIHPIDQAAIVKEMCVGRHAREIRRIKASHAKFSQLNDAQKKALLDKALNALNEKEAKHLEVIRANIMSDRLGILETKAFSELDNQLDLQRKKTLEIPSNTHTRKRKSFNKPEKMKEPLYTKKQFTGDSAGASTSTTATVGESLSPD